MVICGLQAVSYPSKTVTEPWTGVVYFYCVSWFGRSGGALLFVVSLPVSRCLVLGLFCTQGAAQCVGPTSSKKIYLDAAAGI